jgi:hypothetical protein
VAVVPATLEGAVAGHAEHQVDTDAGRHHGANKRAAVAGQVLGETALHVAVEGHADVVPGVVVGAAETQQIDARASGGHAAPSVGWP